MKSIADEVILSFTNQEIREFKYFLGAGVSEALEREDLRMLEMIRKGNNNSQKNVNAHHQTKKRLKKYLEKFTVLENMRHDAVSKIYALMETAKYMFRKNLHRQAWEYLLKAEQLAIEAEEYRLLDYNYDIQISYSYNVATQPPPGFSMQQLLQKWKDNRSLAEMDSNANAAYAILIYKLRELFSKNLSVDVDELIATILNQYGLKDMVYENKLRIYCKIVNLVCRVFREKREYHSLKNYAINSYKVIEKKKAFEKISPDFLLDLLDAICVASLRSNDYVNCEKYTRLYEFHAKQMQAHPGEFSYYDFIPFVGTCDLCHSTNRLEEAKQSMIVAKKKYAKFTASARIYFLLRINLIMVHFSSDEFDTCIKLYNEIKALNEKKILQEPGFRLELILFTEIYGVIFHYEEDDPQYALYLLNKFKRKYADLLKQDESKREKVFLAILEQILSDSKYLKSAKFISEAEQFIKMQQFIAGDFEYISLNAWLRSKLKNKSYYKSFLEFV